MGDYTLCHLHFSFKPETPKEVMDSVSARLKHEPRSSSESKSLAEFYPCVSAYHKIENFVELKPMYSEFYGEFESLKVNTIFQVKYSRGIHEFVDYISPWIIVDEDNRGCIGWTLSEYQNKPTYLFTKNTVEDPRDRYILDLENKCKELVKTLNK